MDYNNYANNEAVLLETFLDATFKPIGQSKFYTSKTFEHLELIITPECNQRCDYCYITKYGKDLYPKHRRANKETSMANLKMIMDYLIYEKHYIFKEYELFAGDMYTTGYMLDVFNLLLPYFQYVYKKVPELNDEMDIRIIVPSNLRFVIDTEFTQQLLEVIKEFEKLGVIMNFSWSHDGKYSSDVREKTELTDEFYEAAFKFCNDTGAGIHPMICAAATPHLIDNYKWWVEMFEKYFPDRFAAQDYAPRFLVVRNGDEWNEESIELYLNYLKFRFEDLIEKYDGDMDKLAKMLFRADGAEVINGDIFDIINYTPLGQEGAMCCSLQKGLMIRISDLAIVPCHRLSYDHFIGGWFEVDEESKKIIGLKANNVATLIDTKSHKANLAPVCASCWNVNFCLGGCLGAQYEWSGELYLPIPSVCVLLKAQTSFILKMLCDTGILQYAHQHDYIQIDKYRHLRNLCERFGYDIDGHDSSGFIQ